MEIFQEYMVAVITGICICVGYIIKQWVKDVNNKYIPTIVGILGVFLNIWLNQWNVSPSIILGGLVSGLASTGMHELFHQFICKKDS